MHRLTCCVLMVLLYTVVNARFAVSSKCSTDGNRPCPSSIRELRRRDDEQQLDDDDEDANEAEPLEELCEQAIQMLVRHRNLNNLDPAMFLKYCPQYQDQLVSVINRNFVADKKRRLVAKKRAALSLDENDGVDKRFALRRRRHLRKRLAVKSLRKRMF